MEQSINPIVEFLKEKHLQITRENYLAVAYMGSLPGEIDPEVEAEMTAALSAAADAQFISRMTSEDRLLLQNLLIRIEVG
jgi:hypothetical protein